MPININPLCNRVVVNDTGLALPPSAACLNYGVVARVIFVRGDGWALGAPAELEHIAYALWQDSWLAFARWPDYHYVPIELYRKPAMVNEIEESAARVESSVIHLIDGGCDSACGDCRGHPVEWPREPVHHTWVRLDRAWRITCDKCREIAAARLAAGQKK